MTNQNYIEAAKEAIEAAGGQTRLAKKLTARRGEEIKATRIYKWGSTGIPPYFVLDVEAITGVSRHELRPDLYPVEDLPV